MLETGNNSGVLPSLTGVALLVHAIPYEEYRDPERLKAFIDRYLAMLWESLLTDDEKQEWSRWSRGQREISPTALLKLDALILHQAGTFGWRLMLSPLVQLRLKAWEQQANGPDFVEQLEKAMSRAARILQGRELPPVNDPGLYRFKQQMTRELRTLLRRFKRSLGNRNDPEQATDRFRSMVVDSDGFPLLRANLDSWLAFLRDTDAVDLLTNIARTRRVSPAALFDAQRAWATGYDQETIRQKISRLGRLKPSLTDSIKL